MCDRVLNTPLHDNRSRAIIESMSTNNNNNKKQVHKMK